MPNLEHPLGFRAAPGFEAQLESTVEYQAALWQKAEQAAAFARSFAPVYQGTYPPESLQEPGDYKRSIHVREGRDGDPELASDDFKAFWIEFGTYESREGGVLTPGHPGMRAYAPLRRGLRAAGINIDEQPSRYEPQARGSKFKDPKTGRYVPSQRGATPD